MSRCDAELIENYRRLDPAGRLFLRELVLRRAQSWRSHFVADLWRSVVSWYWKRAAIAQLRALDDRALKDIGLHRSGIEDAVR